MLHTDGGRYATERVLVKEASNSISAVRERGPVTATRENPWPPTQLWANLRPHKAQKISLSYAAANLSQPCICALAATSIPKIPRHLPKGRRAPREPHKLFNPPYSRDQSIVRRRPGRLLLFHVWAGLRMGEGKCLLRIPACSQVGPVSNPLTLATSLRFASGPLSFPFPHQSRPPFPIHLFA